MLSNTLSAESFSRLFDFWGLSSSLKKTPKSRRFCCPKAGYPNTDPMQAEATYILHAPSVEKKQPLFAGTKENGFNNARYTDFLRFCVNYAEIN